MAIVIGCGASNTAVIEQKRVLEPRPIERVAVFMSIPAAGFDRGIYHGFRQQMARELSACGVESAVVQGIPAETDAAGPVRDPLPTRDARLVVKASGGELTTITTQDQYGNTRDEGTFGEMDVRLWLELLDHTLGRVTWQAFATVSLKNESGPNAGKGLAHAIVANLRADGVLTRCR